MTRRARRWLLGLAGVVVLAGAGSAGVWWLVSTQEGAEWGFERLGGFFPGRLDVKELRGPLRGPFEVRQFAYRNEQMAITADRVVIDWSLRELWRRRLDFRRLHADNVQIVWGAPGETPEAQDSLRGPLPDLNLPVTIIVRDGLLNGLRVSRPGNDSGMVFDRVSLEARSMRRDSLRIDRLSVRSKLVDLDFSGAALPRGAYPLLLRGVWTFRPAGRPPVRGEGTVLGTLDTLRIVQRLSGPVTAQVNLRLYHPLRRLRYEGGIAFSRFSPRDLDPDFPAGTFHGRVDLDGDRDRLAGQGSIRGEAASVGPVAADFRLRGGAGLWHVDQLVVTRPGARGRFQAYGTVVGQSSRARFDLQTEWADAGWPLRGESIVQSERGSARIRGTARDFAIHLEALLAGRDLPPGKWRLEGRGGNGHLNITTVIADLLDGRIVGAGTVAWEPRIRWNLRFDGTGIDPGVVWRAYPGSVSFAGRSEGTTGAAGPSGTILVSRLGGTLRGQPVAGAGTVTARQGQYSLAAGSFQWGPNRAEASGGFGHRWSLNWKLDAPKLGMAIAQASGSLRGEGSIHGTRGRPHFTGTLAGDSLFVGRLHAASLNATGDVDLAPGGAVRLDLAATQVDAGEHTADRLIVVASGTRERNEIRASLADDPDSTVVELAGGFGSDGWRGQLRRLDLVHTRAGTWSLASPAEITATTRAVQVAGLAWGSGSSRVTADGEWVREGPWRVDARLDSVQLSLFEAVLPPRLRVEGTMAGRVAAHATAEGRLYADVDLIPAGRMLHNTSTGQWVPTPFQNAHLRAAADGQRMQAAFGADLVNVGTFRGRVGWPAFGDPSEAGRQPLDGRLELHLRDIAFLQAFTPEVDATAGTLDADLDIDGTLESPFAYGPLALKNASADLPRFGLQLREMNVEGHGMRGGSIALNGSLRSGTGRLTVEGTASVARGARPVANVTVKGERVQAMKTDDMELIASPDLKFLLDGRRLDVTGEVLVPEGKIDLSEQYENVRIVRPSSDVVYTGADTLAEGALEIHSRVRVVLGDRVNIRGFGLEARPTGSVLAIEGPGLPTLGRGQLDIKNGKYQIYGQELDVESGSLIFTGGPITNPAVRARASRKAADGTVAGFIVSGTVMQPNVQVFSEPPMGQSQALSYIMFGKPIESGSLSEGQIASTMATTLGVPGTNLLAHGIASGLGIEEARIEMGKGLETTSVMLGTHLSTKLYVSYGMDVFQTTSSLRLRYILNRIFTIEAETAKQNRVDLLYTVER